MSEKGSNDTELGDNIKDTAVDAARKGSIVGAMGGAAIGGMVGGIAGPVGMAGGGVVGGLAGVIVGGIAGRVVAAYTWFKGRRPTRITDENWSEVGVSVQNVLKKEANEKCEYLNSPMVTNQTEERRAEEMYYGYEAAIKYGVTEMSCGRVCCISEPGEENIWRKLLPENMHDQGIYMLESNNLCPITKVAELKEIATLASEVSGKKAPFMARVLDKANSKVEKIVDIKKQRWLYTLANVEVTFQKIIINTHYQVRHNL